MNQYSFKALIIRLIKRISLRDINIGFGKTRNKIIAYWAINVVSLCNLNNFW